MHRLRFKGRRQEGQIEIEKMRFEETLIAVQSAGSS